MKTTWKTTSVAVVLGLLGSIGAAVCAQQSGQQGTLPSPVQPGTAVITSQAGPSSTAPQHQAHFPPSAFGQAIPSSPSISVAPTATAIYSVSPPVGRQGVAAKFELLTLEDDKFKIERLEGPPSPEQRAAQQVAQGKLREAEQAIRSDKSSDEERAKAKSLLRAYFSAQFQHDLEVRKEQIKQLEEQLTKLRSIVDKRAASMEKIVDLRMTLLENDSNGLGFPPAFQQFAHHDVLHAPPGMPVQPSLPMLPQYPNTTFGPGAYGSLPTGYEFQGPNTQAPRGFAPSNLVPSVSVGPRPDFVPRPLGQPIPPANTKPLERKPNAAKSLEEGV
ncbi:hypothetical protein SH501x_000015 [Pirellulaceae bacterium SH501]